MIMFDGRAFILFSSVANSLTNTHHHHHHVALVFFIKFFFFNCWMSRYVQFTIFLYVQFIHNRRKKNKNKKKHYMDFMNKYVSMVASSKRQKQQSNDKSINWMRCMIGCCFFLSFWLKKKHSEDQYFHCYFECFARVLSACAPVEKCLSRHANAQVLLYCCLWCAIHSISLYAIAYILSSIHF